MVACKYRRFRPVIRLLPLFLLFLPGAKNLHAQVVELITERGTIKLQLYDDTPLHKANFLKNVREGRYNGVLFHRVIKDFMIQTGEPSTVNAKPKVLLGGDTGKETLPAEIKAHHGHKRGAIAAARQPDQTNPQKRSSQYQFYIVDGRDYTLSMLRQLENTANRPKRHKVADSLLTTRAAGDTLSESWLSKKQLDSLIKAKDYRNADKILAQMQEETDKIIGPENLLKYTDQQITDYTTIGGVPNLDGKYTVFGEVIEGLEVIDLISEVETDTNNRPHTDIKLLKAIVIE